MTSTHRTHDKKSGGSLRITLTAVRTPGFRTNGMYSKRSKKAPDLSLFSFEYYRALEPGGFSKGGNEHVSLFDGRTTGRDVTRTSDVNGQEAV